MKKSWIMALFVSLVLLPNLIHAKSQAKIIRSLDSDGMKVLVEQLADGLGIPWGFDFLTDNIMIITDRSGRIHLLNLENLRLVAVEGVPDVYQKSQGGLLDIHKHPDFAKNQVIYFTYSVAHGDGATTRLTQAKLVKNELKELKVLFTAETPSTKNVHFGSRLAIDKNGFLYMSIGDRGERERAQNLSEHAGKILRFHLDGSVPKDNPFVGKKNAKPEIWSYGHRNPQGLTLHPQTGALWSHEHGPRGGDEINVIQKGGNYGWPLVTFGREYWGPKIGTTQKKGMIDPLHQWTPSIAPSGMSFYTGKAFPKWQGNLFSGSMVLTHVNRIVLQDHKFVKEERLLDDWGLRIRSIKTGPDGFIYFASDQGQLLRFRPAS
ncbi:MAG: PQQ-dependent sugar dehydrogenase [Oligoflexus sp.]